MSDVEQLKNENENLKQQLAQNTQGVKGLLAQVDAYRQTVADSNNINLQLRTNVILMQQANKEQLEKIECLSKEIVDLNKQLAEANKKIAEFQITEVTDT